MKLNLDLPRVTYGLLRWLFIVVKVKVKAETLVCLFNVVTTSGDGCGVVIVLTAVFFARQALIFK